VVPLTAYATTLRSKVIDFAVKIVKHSREITLKVTTAVWKVAGRGVSENRLSPGKSKTCNRFYLEKDPSRLLIMLLILFEIRPVIW